MNGVANYVLPEVKRCMGYEKLGSVEIRLLDLDSFISYAKKFKPDNIWSCYGELCNKFKTADGKPPDFEWQGPYPYIFFFVKGNEIYSAESGGFKQLGDYLNAKNIGFLREEAHNLRDCVSERYEKMTLASLYYETKRNGYKKFNEFNMAYIFYNDFVPVDERRIGNGI
jgi:hypothetical protein